ncbi:MAG: polysaccharide biosynthesis/export family protein [Microcoleaceae cyanobacterium]
MKQLTVYKGKSVFKFSRLGTGGVFSVFGIGIMIGSSLPAQAQFLPPPPGVMPPPPQTSAPVLVPPASSEAYVLGVGDRLQLDVFNVPEYSGPNGQHQVSVDGAINLPLIGSVPVRGLTLDQVKKTIETRYAEYLQRPLVTLTLLSVRPIQVAIAGEVQRPGAYTFSGANGGNPALVGLTQPASGLQFPTVTQLLQMAGGVTPLADVRQVKVRRQQPGATEQVVGVDLWELLQSGDLRQDIALRDGDMIYIPTVTDLNRTEVRQLAAANFASSTTQPISVAVVGEINRPGTHTLAPDAGIPGQSGNPQGNPQLSQASAEGMGVFTVTRAIKTAGGITQTADIRKIEVRRLSRTGTEQVISVDLWKLLQDGDLTQDVVLQQGDTIVIPVASNSDLSQSEDVSMASFSPDTIQVSIVGEVMRPGPVEVPPNTALNQALGVAGGFNEARAKTEEVELIRLNPDGTVARRKISVNFSAQVNDQTNPVLRHNDVVLVGRSGSAAFRDGFGGVLSNISPFNGVLGILRFVGIFN